MDKEQAIDLLDNLIGMIEDNQDNDYDTAFRMAIEALKAQLPNEGTTKDTISRQAALDAIHNLYAIHGSEGSWIDQKDAFKALNSLPSAQPEPQEGHWIEGKIYRGVIECNCSECGQLMTTAASVRMNYCPNCGAKMKGATT